MASPVTIAILVSLALAALGAYHFLGTGKKRGSSLGRVSTYDPKTGIGRGAPGFQTNVTRIAVPAHIVARIRAGEDVSAEEITAAQHAGARRLEQEAKAQAKGQSLRNTKSASGLKVAEQSPAARFNEWIPQGHDAIVAGGAQRAKGKRK